MEKSEEKIIEITRNLPSTVEELVDFVIVGNEAIKGFKAKLKATEKADIVEGARKIALRDGIPSKSTDGLYRSICKWIPRKVLEDYFP